MIEDQFEFVPVSQAMFDQLRRDCGERLPAETFVDYVQRNPKVSQSEWQETAYQKLNFGPELP
jgi:hypothetical protein